MIRRVLLALLLAGAAFVGTGSASAALADDGLDHSCATNLGTTLPVVLVHGWRSNANDWGPAAAEIARLDGVTTVQFDYEQWHTNWVTDPHIGPALARLITCLAGNSDALGGPGKVLAVGHSMGGLAIRCALQPTCSGVPGVEPDVAQVITIGTPTHGSFLRYGGTIGQVARMSTDIVCDGVRRAVNAARGATPDPAAVEQQNLCQAFLSNDAAVAFNDSSTELKALRAESTTVPVLALAGDIKLDVAVLFHQFTVADGDAIVDVRSQQSWATQAGDVDCGRIVLGATIADFGYALTGQNDKLTNYKCWHGSETTNANVINQIRAKVSQVKAQLTPAPGPANGDWTPFGGADVSNTGGVLRVSYPDTYWGGAVASVPGCDQRVSGQARLVNGDGYGIALRAGYDGDQPTSGPAFQYDAGIGGYRFTEYPDSEGGTTVSAPTDNEWHGFSLEVRGSHYSVEMDGHQVYSGDTHVACGGGILIRVWRSTAEFRNLTLAGT